MKQVHRAIQVAALAVIAASLSGCSYNRFVSDQEAIKAQWAQVENQLQRRNNLIPNLVETVKGYAGHEREVFESVAASRAQLAGARGNPDKEIAAANQQTQALARLLAIVENYPQLKANENFMKLQDELTDTEDKIQAARRFYNGMVRDLNTKIQVFPTNLFASMFGFTKMDFFGDLSDAEKQPIRVKF